MRWAGESAPPGAGHSALGTRGPVLPTLGTTVSCPKGIPAGVWVGKLDLDPDGLESRRGDVTGRLGVWPENERSTEPFEIATERERREAEKEEDSWLFLRIGYFFPGVRINKISSQGESSCLKRA